MYLSTFFLYLSAVKTQASYFTIIPLLYPAAGPINGGVQGQKKRALA